MTKRFTHFEFSVRNPDNYTVMINFGQDGDGVYRGEEYRKVQTEDEAVALMGSIISIGGTSGVVTGRNVNNEEIEEILWIN